MEIVFRFEQLEIYQLACDIVIDNYGYTRKFPVEERYALASQMNRAAVSIPSNIAEGVSRNSRKDQIHFINIAYASLMELICQVNIACKLGYIDGLEKESFYAKAKNLAIKMNNFTKHLKSTFN